MNTLHVISAELESDYLGWGWEIQERECPYWLAKKPAITETPNWKGVQLPERHSIAGLSAVDIDAMPYGGRCWDWSPRSQTLFPSGRKNQGRDLRPHVVIMILECFAQGYDFQAFIELGKRKPKKAERIHRELLCLGIRALIEMGNAPKAIIRATGLTAVQVSRLRRAPTPLLFENLELRERLPDINIIDSRNGSYRWTDLGHDAQQAGGHRRGVTVAAGGESHSFPPVPLHPPKTEIQVTPAAEQRLARIEGHLIEIRRDIADGVQRIRDTFPTEAEVSAVVDAFVDEALRSDKA